MFDRRRLRYSLSTPPHSLSASRGGPRARRAGVTLRRPAALVGATRWMQALTAGVLSVYATFFVIFFHRSGPGDSDQYLVFHRLQYWNQELFTLAKQWTPVMCSGLSMAGEPQIPFMSLSMTLSYLLGPLWGVKIASIVYLALGW